MRVRIIGTLFAITLLGTAVLVFSAGHPGRLKRESQASNNLEQRIHRVESGLIPLDPTKGETPTFKSLIERMHHYKVSGVSEVPQNEYTKTEKVTLRRILSHSAGLTVHAVAGFTVGERVPSLVDIFKRQEGNLFRTGCR